MGASGASGGILQLWDRRVVEKIEESVRRYTIACSLRNTNDNFVWAFEGVYGPNDDGDMRFLWDELFGLMSWWEMSWCFGEISMWLGFLARDQVILDILRQWWSFRSSFLCKAWWIYPLNGASLLGLIIRKATYGLELTDSYYLRSGKNFSHR